MKLYATVFIYPWIDLNCTIHTSLDGVILDIKEYLKISGLKRSECPKKAKIKKYDKLYDGFWVDLSDGTSIFIQELIDVEVERIAKFLMRN